MTADELKTEYLTARNKVDIIEGKINSRLLALAKKYPNVLIYMNADIPIITGGKIHRDLTGNRINDMDDMITLLINFEIAVNNIPE